MYIRKNYRIDSERQLSNLPIVLLPGSTLHVNIPQWSTLKNKRVQDYIAPEFLECGCGLGLYLVIVSFLSTIGVFIVYFSAVMNHFPESIWIAVVGNVFIALTGKSVATIRARISLRKKIKTILTDVSIPVDRPEIKKRLCRCGS